jgi:hypothetical protein
VDEIDSVDGHGVRGCEACCGRCCTFSASAVIGAAAAFGVEDDGVEAL